jgi:transcriptional regulator MraZ
MIDELRKCGFVGSTRYKKGSKNRVCFPPEFVDTLKNEFKDDKGRVIVCINAKFNICIFPESEYFKWLDSFKAEPLHNDDKADTVDFIKGCAIRQKLDVQNRIRLSEELCDYASIDKEVYVKGYDNHVEVWAKECWDKFVKSTMLQIKNNAKKSGRSRKNV